MSGHARSEPLPLGHPSLRQKPIVIVAAPRMKILAKVNATMPAGTGCRPKRLMRSARPSPQLCRAGATMRKEMPGARRASSFFGSARLPQIDRIVGADIDKARERLQQHSLVGKGEIGAADGIDNPRAAG